MATESLESGNAAYRGVTWGMGGLVTVEGTQESYEQLSAEPLAPSNSARMKMNGGRANSTLLPVM